MTSVGSPLLWIGFSAVIVLMLVLDLGIFHRRSHVVKVKEALTWSIVWIALAVCFDIFIFWKFGATKGLEFLTGYLIEEALSVDNLFVFLVIFSFFSVPTHLLHRVLFWGILGAMIMRGLFVAAGAALVSNFHWVIYVFGALLVVTGIRLLRSRHEEQRPDQNIFVKLYQRCVPSIAEYRGNAFIVKENGRRYATRLLLVLVVIEITDVIFAVDSIPAIFAITTDPFIVYTSNIFAILGLRSLFFLLSGMMEKFHYLNVGLSMVLIFVGIKMLIADLYPLPIYVSLIVVALLLTASVVASLLLPSSPPQRS